MDRDTDKLIEEQLKTLPQALQRAIALTPWRNLLTNIVKANNLQDEMAKNLETETMLVIYGFESQDDFSSNIMRELSLDVARATIIAGEVDKQVFAVILEKANEFQEASDKETPHSSQVIPINKPEIVSSAIVEKKPDLPMVIVKTLPFEERKKLVPDFLDNKHHYPDNNDPYREPTN